MRTVRGRTFNIVKIEALIRNDQIRKLIKKASPEVKRAMRIIDRFYNEHRKEII